MNNKNISSTDLIINDLSNKNNRLTDKIHELENKLKQIKEQNFDFFELPLFFKTPSYFISLP